MNVNNSVLVVGDEKMIRDAVSAYFTKMGWHCYEADNGPDALSLFEETKANFVILDFMLPGISGEEVCSAIRKKSKVPIIMLTAKTGEESILNGLNIGADDYVTKPFSVKQLYARAEAIMRRVGNEHATLKENDLSINFEEASVRKNGELLSLTKSEWKILCAMASYKNKVFTRDELLEIAFGADADSYDRVIDTHIKNLRKKIEDDSANPVYIKTVHGMGYRFGGEKQ